MVLELDNELASAMHFIIAASENPHPYYWNIPQDFVVPAVYFPQPEIDTRGDTFSTYALNFSWFVRFFHKDNQLAHTMAFSSLTALQQNRNAVPIINANGNPTGKIFRMHDPNLRIISDGVAQLHLRWDSPRPYRAEKSEKITVFRVRSHIKNAFTTAINQIGGNNG